MEAFQEGEEPQWEIVAFPLHEAHFLIGNADIRVAVELLPQLLGETFRLNRVVAVHESLLSHGEGELLQVGVAHAEGV